MQSLYDGCNGDIRSMLTTLQMWRSDSRALSKDDVEQRMQAASKNVMQISVIDNTMRMYKTDSALQDKMEWFFLDSDMLPFFMFDTYAENAAKVPNQMEGMALAARPSLIPSLCTRFTRAGIEWRR